MTNTLLLKHIFFRLNIIRPVGHRRDHAVQILLRLLPCNLIQPEENGCYLHGEIVGGRCKH